MPRCQQTGKVTRSRFTSLKMAELSSVDRPAQPGALATIMKRDDSVPPVKPTAKGAPSLLAMSVAKYVDSEDGAHTFAEVLQANEFDEKIWPMVSALSQSIRSIMGDKDIKGADKETKVTQSVDEFLAAVRDLSPAAEKRLAELITTTKGQGMNWQERAEKAEGELATAKARVTTLEGELATEKSAHGDTKKALTDATDETIKVDGQDVRKSAVGEASFAVFKSLDNRATIATLEKRADDDFGHVVGTATEKALVLKSALQMDEPTRKAFDAIMTSAEAMAKGAFGRLGGGGGQEPSGDVAKALDTFSGKVAEIAKRDNITTAQAMSKARREHPAEHAAAYPAQAA